MCDNVIKLTGIQNESKETVFDYKFNLQNSTCLSETNIDTYINDSPESGMVSKTEYNAQIDYSFGNDATEITFAFPQTIMWESCSCEKDNVILEVNVPAGVLVTSDGSGNAEWNLVW